MTGNANRLHLLRAALAVALACAVAGLWPAAGSRAAQRSHGAPAHGPRYPAGATRPAFRTSRKALAAAAKKKPRKPAAPVLHGNPARGLRAFQAMQRAYYLLGSGLYKGEPFSYLWPFSQGLAATVSMSFVPAIAKVPELRASLARELKARLVGLRNYYDANNSGQPEGFFNSTVPAYDGTVAPPTGPGGTKYYDDNDWVGIELMRIYGKTREPGLLAAAEEIMAFE